jgi:hypothetical protein
MTLFRKTAAAAAFSVAVSLSAAMLSLAPQAVADSDDLPDYSEHGIFAGFPFVSDDYTPWLNIEDQGFNVYGSGVLPWHFNYGINLGDADSGFTGESIGAVDGLGGTVDIRSNGLDFTNAETYGNYISNPANPDTEGFYCVICNEFQVSAGDNDVTAILNVFSNAAPQLEIDYNGEDIFGDALSNGSGPASALNPDWWFTPEDFPNLNLLDIFGI